MAHASLRAECKGCCGRAVGNDHAHTSTEQVQRATHGPRCVLALVLPASGGHTPPWVCTRSSRPPAPPPAHLPTRGAHGLPHRAVARRTIETPAHANVSTFAGVGCRLGRQAAGPGPSSAGVGETGKVAASGRRGWRRGVGHARTRTTTTTTTAPARAWSHSAAVAVVHSTYDHRGFSRTKACSSEVKAPAVPRARLVHGGSVVGKASGSPACMQRWGRAVVIDDTRPTCTRAHACICTNMHIGLCRRRPEGVQGWEGGEGGRGRTHCRDAHRERAVLVHLVARAAGTVPRGERPE